MMQKKKRFLSNFPSTPGEPRRRRAGYGTYVAAWGWGGHRSHPFTICPSLRNRNCRGRVLAQGTIHQQPWYAKWAARNSFPPHLGEVLTGVTQGWAAEKRTRYVHVQQNFKSQMSCRSLKEIASIVWGVMTLHRCHHLSNIPALYHK